jgi:C4-type Zn-finger protein
VRELTLNVFTVTVRCPVCAGSANARYRAPHQGNAGQMRHKCTDCGFTWDQAPAARAF